MSQLPLELRQVVKRYKKGVEIGPISIDLDAGKFLSLLGPSGCGKSTLLRCIAGFEKVNGGDILIGGRSVLDLPPNRRDVGFVFQNYALFPHLTIAENIAFGLRRRGVEAAECDRRVGEMLERVGLAGLGQRRPSQLSGGQQQRVALARVLVLDPGVLLLDEPLSSLDRKLRVQMRAELRRVHREFQKTVVYVTHDQEEALSLSDQIAIMLDHSQIAQFGTPNEIYQAPLSPKVADFIGDCNMYRCVVKDVSTSSGTVRMETSSGMLLNAKLPPEGYRINDTVVALFRPESIRLGPSEPGLASNTLSVRLVEQSYGGQRITYFGTLNEADAIQITIPVDNLQTPLPSIGQTMNCHLHVDDIFTFPDSA
ncbi:ABC transporter ATP-binding protein [Parapusillimonas sp. SGNA-6]|nr:ABC transporter ATP-binding protein [Parapusillimonas sp. SGNA-6]